MYFCPVNLSIHPVHVFFSIYPVYQGELINQIEYNVEHAAGYVERGTKMVRIARDYKSKNRQVRKMIIEQEKIK